MPTGAPQYSEKGKKFSSSEAMNLDSTKVEAAPEVWNLPQWPEKLSRNISCLCGTVNGGLEAPEQLSWKTGTVQKIKWEGLCPSPDEFVPWNNDWGFCLTVSFIYRCAMEIYSRAAKLWSGFTGKTPCVVILAAGDVQIEGRVGVNVHNWLLTSSRLCLHCIMCFQSILLGLYLT